MKSFQVAIYRGVSVSYCIEMKQTINHTVSFATTHHFIMFSDIWKGDTGSSPGLNNKLSAGLFLRAVLYQLDPGILEYKGKFTVVPILSSHHYPMALSPGLPVNTVLQVTCCVSNK